MKVVGLITEYNPFHNGHLYHIEQAKKITNADYVVVIMSGNFIQRGEPAVIDKFVRADMALLNGVDLVLELPVSYACSSAEYFASGAVALLDKLGIVDSLCFGSECGNITILQTIASLLLKEPAEYKEQLKYLVKSGITFPKARAQSLLSYCLKYNILPELGEEALGNILFHPNNILGIEYIKALLKRGSKITPTTITRISSGYHDQTLDDSISSATAIRKHIQSSGDFLKIQSQIPENVLSLLKGHYHTSFPITADDFSLLLRYQMLLSKPLGYAEYCDVSDDLSRTIINHLSDYFNFTQFSRILKSKNFTSTRINRAFIHILLQIRKDDFKNAIENDYIYYFRVLGFRKDSTDLLSAIKLKSSIPLITKLTHAAKLLNKDGLNMLNKDLLSSQIYHCVVTDKFQKETYNEFKQQLIIV
jgi:cytidyltransferase-like protein